MHTSAIEKPRNKLKKPVINQPHVKEIVPPKVNPVLKSVVTPVKIEITANENAKFDTALRTQKAHKRIVL